MVLYDIGHGGTDPGAVANGIKESELVLDIGIMAASATRALGYNVGLTRTDQSTLLAARRKELITQPHLDVVVSIHANSAISVGARGFEIFVSCFNYESQSLGYSIASSFVRRGANIPPRNPAVKIKLRENQVEDFYYVINDPTKVGIPAVLVEVGFLSNVDDARFLGSFWGKFLVANLLSVGVSDYLAKIAE